MCRVIHIQYYRRIPQAGSFTCLLVHNFYKNSFRVSEFLTSPMYVRTANFQRGCECGHSHTIHTTPCSSILQINSLLCASNHPRDALHWGHMAHLQCAPESRTSKKRRSTSKPAAVHTLLDLLRSYVKPTKNWRQQRTMHDLQRKNSIEKHPLQATNTSVNRTHQEEIIHRTHRN